MPSPPLAVHERGSHGARGSTDGVGAWNAPELPVLPVLAGVVVVDAAGLFAVPSAEVGVVVAGGALTVKSVPVTTVTCEPGFT